LIGIQGSVPVELQDFSHGSRYSAQDYGTALLLVKYSFSKTLFGAEQIDEIPDNKPQE
jgi:hypothetical protein